METVRPDERHGFRDRLHRALRAENLSARPSAFARGFNLRADGAAVTPHAARKWLVGEAIPTQERMVILANWLNVTAAWLRFGAADETEHHNARELADSLTQDETDLVRAVIALSKPSQAVVQELVQALRRLESTMTVHATAAHKARSQG